MSTDPTGGAGARDDSLLVALFDESPVPTLRTEAVDGLVGRVLDANPAARRVLGAADPTGMPLSELAGAAVGVPVTEMVTRHLLTVPSAGDPSGESVRWIEASVVALSAAASPGRPAALVLLHDVTERRAYDHRRDQEQRLDPLTGLANRHDLRARLSELDVGLDGPAVAALFLDLDRFKLVNDTRGHAAGDELLVAVAHRLRAVVRPEDLVARVGGDEFVVLCPRLAGPAEAAVIAERVRAAVDRPIEIGGRLLRITASVGAATAEVGLLDPTALLGAADGAMYAAKQAGGDRIAEHAQAARRALRWPLVRRR